MVERVSAHARLPEQSSAVTDVGRLATGAQHEQRGNQNECQSVDARRDTVNQGGHEIFFRGELAPRPGVALTGALC